MIGYRHFLHEGMRWRWHHGALIPLTMPHVPVTLSTFRAVRITILRRAIFIRWGEAFDRTAATEWWHTIKDSEENVSTFGKKMRNQLRRAEKAFSAFPVSRNEILGDGYPVYQSAFARYETFETILSETDFRNAILELPDETEFWVVCSSATRETVGFSENLVRDNACYYNTMWFRPDALTAYAGYLLIHAMNKHYLNDRKLKYVSNGSRNISHQTNIHDFLEHKFGFRRAYSRLHIVYFPGFGILVRLLYVFRRWTRGKTSPWIRKADILLEQERIRRACAASSKTA